MSRKPVYMTTGSTARRKRLSYQQCTKANTMPKALVKNALISTAIF